MLSKEEIDRRLDLKLKQSAEDTWLELVKIPEFKQLTHGGTSEFLYTFRIGFTRSGSCGGDSPSQ